MKKYIIQISFLILFLAYLFASCKNTTNADEEKYSGAKTVDVTFFNESRYNLKVHRDSFDGPVLLELPVNSNAETIPVRVSDNKGVGTVFSIEYIWTIQIIDGLDADIKIVPISGIDPNLQILSVLEVDKPCTIQISDPINLEIRSTYMTIFNSYNLPCVLRYYGSLQNQINDNNVPIAPGKTGIYKNPYAIPVEGELYQGYRVESIPIPEFIMKNGGIYHFKFDGNKVEMIKEENIIFNM